MLERGKSELKSALIDIKLQYFRGRRSLILKNYQSLQSNPVSNSNVSLKFLMNVATRHDASFQVNKTYKFCYKALRKVQKRLSKRRENSHCVIPEQPDLLCVCFLKIDFISFRFSNYYNSQNLSKISSASSEINSQPKVYKSPSSIAQSK